MKLVALLAFIVVLDARRADACSCAPPPPACEAFQSTQVVFVGKVTEQGSGSVTMTVTETFKGNLGDTEVVDAGGDMCGASFAKGKSYIVYAMGASGRLSTSMCTRTAEVKAAKEDVAYARGFAKRTLGIIEGKLTIGDAVRAGAEVRARDTKYKTKSDRTGRYKLELPPGRYTIDVVDKQARVPADTSEVVNVAAPSSCMHRNIALVWNGRVRGKVIGVDGAPAANVQLTLVATGASRTGNQFATTDAKGAYEFAGVQEGEYHVVVYSARGVPTTTYYPNVDDATKAKSIKLSQAGVVQKIDVKLLP